MAELTQGMVVNNRYTLLEYKGRGSFGEVWLAHDDTLGIDVALKIYISLDQRGVDEFKSEYTTTLGLSHPALLTASFFDVWDSRPFLVMKFCDKGSSSSLVGRATELDTWQFIHDVASGLAYLHDQPEPIIHQDIKPDNILVNNDDHFLITDFGISKRVRATMRKQSKRAVGAGATAYMGPERFGEDPSPVKASDVWSLGVSAYELVAGELPFSGMGGGMLLSGAALPNLPQGWNPHLNDLVRRMLEKEPWDRPTAQQIADYTREVLNGNDISYEEWNKGPQAPASKKKLFIGIAAGVVAVIGIIIAVIFLTGNKVKVDNSNTEIEDHFVSLMSLCKNNVKVATPENPAVLMEAKLLLDSLKWYKEEYPELEDKDELDFTDLEHDLNDKLKDASETWAKSAEGQLSIANDPIGALDYYLIAARLNDTPELTSKLEDLGEKTGCKASTMLISGVKVVGDRMTIYYDGAQEASIPDVTLRYEVKERGGNPITAQSKVTVASGRGKSLSIELNSEVENPTEVTINSGNLTLFEGPVIK